MYADLLPGREDDVVIPSETVRFLEQKIVDFIKLVLKEVECCDRASNGGKKWIIHKRGTAWGDPQVFTSLKKFSELVLTSDHLVAAEV